MWIGIPFDPLPSSPQGYTLEAEGRDASGSARKGTSTIIDYVGSATRVATLHPPLDFEPEKGDK